jgi:predicted HTH transcriptional regulator
MIDIQSLEDISLLRETVSLECKLANGRDGKGALPEDFWPSYSAMANTDGGVVVLGLRERKDTLRQSASTTWKRSAPSCSTTSIIARR